jgi:hypothetical protein
MQAAQPTPNIQTLLEAEKEAARIVQQARQCTLRQTPSLYRALVWYEAYMHVPQTECSG